MSQNISWDKLSDWQLTTKILATATGTLDAPFFVRCIAVHCGGDVETVFNVDEKGRARKIVWAINQALMISPDVATAYVHRNTRDRKSSAIIRGCRKRLQVFKARWDLLHLDVTKTFTRLSDHDHAALCRANEQALAVLANLPRPDPSPKKPNDRSKALRHLKKAREAASRPEDTCAILSGKVSALTEEAEKMNANACRPGTAQESRHHELQPFSAARDLQTRSS